MTFIPMKWYLIGCLFICLVAIEILSFVSVMGVALSVFPLVWLLIEDLDFLFLYFIQSKKGCIFKKGIIVNLIIWL